MELSGRAERLRAAVGKSKLLKMTGCTCLRAVARQALVVEEVPAEFDAFIRAELQQNEKIARQANIRIE